MVRQLWRCASEILSAVFTEYSPTAILIHEFGLMIIYPVIPVCIKCKILRSPYCIYKFRRLAFIKGILFIFSRQEVRSRDRVCNHCLYRENFSTPLQYFCSAFEF